VERCSLEGILTPTRAHIHSHAPQVSCRLSLVLDRTRTRSHSNTHTYKHNTYTHKQTNTNTNTNTYSSLPQDEPSLAVLIAQSDPGSHMPDASGITVEQALHALTLHDFLPGTSIKTDRSDGDAQDPVEVNDIDHILVWKYSTGISSGRFVRAVPVLFVVHRVPPHLCRCSSHPLPSCCVFWGVSGFVLDTILCAGAIASQITAESWECSKCTCEQAHITLRRSTQLPNSSSVNRYG
jgi:hypothetical protein